MSGTIAVRRETKSTLERRTPITPDLVAKLVKSSGVEVLVQPSARRVFPDNEYVHSGARVAENLADSKVILGVKEIPPDLFQPDTAYVFFSHVIKGQPYNMPMLAKVLELGCTLIDYEKICDETGKRLIFFGRFAGLAGMIDSLWALGQRLRREGIPTPLASIEQAHEYESLHDAKIAIRKAGERIASEGLPEELTPLTIGIAGYGNVANGVREILSELPTREIAPETIESTFKDPSPHCLYQTTFREEHLVETEDGRAFELQAYYDHPEGYRSVFDRYLPQLTVLMNCNYWDERYPRLVTKEQLRAIRRGCGSSAISVAMSKELSSAPSSAPSPPTRSMSMTPSREPSARASMEPDRWCWRWTSFPPSCRARPRRSSPPPSHHSCPPSPERTSTSHSASSPYRLSYSAPSSLTAANSPRITPTSKNTSQPIRVDLLD